MESYSVEAILSAVDKNFSSTMNRANESMDSLDDNSKKTGTSISSIAKGIGVFKLVESAVGLVISSVDGAINRFDTLKKYPVVMQALGYSSKQTDASMSKLGKSIDGLPTSLNEIVSSTQQIAIATGSLEKGTDTAIALNDAFLASGASAADASRGMQQYVQMLGKGEVDLESWRSVQETMPIALDKVAKSFKDEGVSSVNDLYAALKKGDITFDQFNQRLIKLDGGVGGFADLARKNSSGIATSFANIKTAVTKGIANIIATLDEGMQNAGMGSIADNFDKIKAVVNEVFGAITKAIPPALKTLTSVYNTIKPFLPMIIAIVSYITTYQAIMGTATRITKMYSAVQATLNAVMAANPIGLLIAAIVLLVAGFVYLWKTSDKFRQFWYGLWDGIKKAVSSAVDAIKEAWDSTKKWFGDTWDSFKQSAADAWDSIKQGASDVVTGIKDAFAAIVAPFQPLIDAAKESFNKIKEAASTIFQEIMNLVANYFEILKNIVLAPVLFIASLISGGWDEAISNMQQVWGNIVTSAQEIWDSVSAIFSTVITTITETATTMWSGFKEVLSTIWQGIADIASNVWNGMKDFFANTWQSIQDTAINAWNGIKSGVEDIWNGMVNGAANAWESLKKGVSDAIDRVKNTFDNLRNVNLFEIGKNIIDGLVNGIQNKIQAVKDAVTNIASNITGSIKKILNIHSPSRVMAQLGMYTAQGLANGMTNGADSVANAAGILASSANPNIDIGANVAAANRSISSTIAHDINLNKGKQSATFMLNLGKQQFKAFVDDISNAQGNAIKLNMQF